MYPVSQIDELRLGKIKQLHSVSSAINKQPVDSIVVSIHGLMGDEQADKIHHGGEDRAILQYDSEHYQQLKNKFPSSSHLFIQGAFGENLVVAGMNEHNICIGDIVTVGSVILQVTQPRQPCFKLNYRFNEPAISRFVQNNFKTGWFYRVLEKGIIKIGETIEIVGIKDTQTTTVTGVEMFRKEMDQGEAGDNCGVLLRGVKKEDVQRGQVLIKPGTITPHTEFRCETYILSKEEGGRHTPFFSGYRPQFYIRTTDVTGSVTLPEGTEMVMPGDNVEMNVVLVAPVALEKGTKFAIREGGRTVGAGVVAEITK